MSILAYIKRLCKFSQPDPARLTLNDLHDRAYVLVNGKLAGTLTREGDMYVLPISAPRHASLDLVVESQGRVTIGRHLNDFKVSLRAVAVAVMAVVYMSIIVKVVIKTVYSHGDIGTTDTH